MVQRGIVGIVGIAIGGTAWGQSAAIAHQGRLLDAVGDGLNGTYTLTFRIYDGSGSGAGTLWSEQESVPVRDGYYAVVLGDGTPFPAGLFEGPPRWLGVQVDAQPELVPRQPLVSTPTAFHAFHAATAEDATGDISPTSVTVAGTQVIDAAGRWSGPSPAVQVTGAYLSGNGTASSPLSVDLGTHVGNAAAHHTRYTNTEAVGALSGRAVVLGSCGWVEDACEVDGGFLVYLDRMNNLSCPANKVLVDMNVGNCGGGNYQMKFYCCALQIQ